MSCSLHAEISYHCLALKYSFSVLTTESSRLSPCLSQTSHSQANKLDALPLSSYNAWYFPITAFKEMYYTYYRHMQWYSNPEFLINQLKCEFFEKKDYVLFTCVYVAWHIADTQ